MSSSQSEYSQQSSSEEEQSEEEQSEEEYELFECYECNDNHNLFSNGKKILCRDCIFGPLIPLKCDECSKTNNITNHSNKPIIL